MEHVPPGNIMAVASAFVDPLQSAIRNGEEQSGVHARPPAEVDVCFHVIISSSFKRHEHKVPSLFVHLKTGGGKQDIPLTIKRPIRFGYQLFYGKGKLREDLLDSTNPIRYSYQINNVQEAMPSFLEEDRCLDVKDWRNSLEENGTLQQYDYVIYKESHEYADTQKVESLTAHDQFVTKIVRDAQLAMLTYLPLWEGFCSTQLSQTMNPLQAIRRVHCIWKCLATSSTMYKQPVARASNLFLPTSLKPKDFALEEVLLHFISRKIETYQNPEDIQDFKQKEKQLISAVAITQLINIYRLQLSSELQHKLCLGLKFPVTDRDRCTELLTKLWSEFQGNVGESLVILVRSMPATTFDWLLVLPLFHFLMENNEPYKPVQMTSNSTSDVWWGVQNLQKQPISPSDIFPECALLSTVEEIASLFEMDYMLVRSVIWLFSATPSCIQYILKTDKIAHHASPSMICRGLQRACTKLDIDDLYETQSLREDIQLLIHKVKSDVEDELQPYNELMETITKQTNIAHHEIVYEGYMLFAIATTACQNNTQSDVTKKDKNMEQFKDANDHIESWLQQRLPKKMVKDTYDEHVTLVTLEEPLEPEVTSQLLSVGKLFPEENGTAQTWAKMLLHLWQQRLKTMPDEEKVLFFCSCSIATTLNIHGQLQHTLHKESLTAMDNIICRDSQLNTDFKKRLSGIIRFEQQRQGAVRRTLVDILKWQPFHIIFRIQATGNTGMVLEDDVEHSISSDFTYFKSICTNTQTGDIDIESLKSILQNAELFLSLFKVTYGSTSDAMKKLLEKRQLELRTFEEQWELTKNLRRVCTFLEPISVSDIEEKMKKVMRDIQLKDVCQPATTSACKEMPSVELVPEEAEKGCTFFQHSEEVQEMLQPLHIAFQCSLYRRHLEEKANDVRMEYKHSRKISTQCRQISLTVEDLAKQVWSPVHRDLQQLVEDFRTGCVKLGKVEDYLGHLKKASEEDLKKDILQLFELCGVSNEDHISQRTRQVKHYFSVQKVHDVAKGILNFKKSLNLGGSFSRLTLLCKLSSGEGRNETLDSIDDDVIKLQQTLEKIQTEDQLKQLDEFQESGSKNLVTWIRQEINDMHELEVFVDLAAGDTSAEFETVLKFHHAATGYAPFIWDLNKDPSLKKFLEVIEKLSTANRKDPNLKSQWQETKKCLPILRQVKEAMDSSPLQQAEIINKQGIYTIGKLDSLVQVENGEPTILILRTSDSDKPYTLSELQDLQSKLSLVVGKVQQGSKGGRDQMEYFTEVFGTMQRLSEIYASLCSAGNTLFLNWKATFICGPNATTRHTVCMDFGVGEECRMYGTRPLEDELPCLLEFMENCLQRWDDHVRKKRDEHYYLNYFTTEQLLRLCHDLACRSNQEEKETSQESTQLFALLSCLCHGKEWKSIQESLNSSMESATQEILESQMSGSAENSDIQAAEKQKRTMLAARIAEDNGVPEAVALAAIQELGTEREDDEYVTWCMDHPAGGKNEAPIHSVTRSWKQIVTDTLIELATHDSHLDERLRALLERYLDSIKCVDSDEYLSLDYLGRILKHLAHEERIDARAAVRKLPTYLKEGQPNLIVCSARDVLATVLSIYYGGPLPTHGEVLVCTNDTSFEEVSLLWRRAVGDRSGRRIFCLANAERLEYHTSERAGNLLQELLQRATDKCRLVVICTQEEEHDAHMVTKLHQYRTELPPTEISNKQNIPNYLLKEFQKRATGANAAATLTDLRSTAVAVVSNCSGAGKTTVIEEYTKQLRRQQNGDANATSAICITVPLHDACVSNEAVVKALLPHMVVSSHVLPRIFHFDVAPMVKYGLDDLLFNLLVLGRLVNKHGYIWKCRQQDLYIVEITDVRLTFDQTLQTTAKVPWFHTFLPHIICRSPSEVLRYLKSQQLSQSPMESHLDTRLEETQNQPTQITNWDVPLELSPRESVGHWQNCDPTINDSQFAQPGIQCAFRYLYHHIQGHNLNEYVFSDDEAEFQNMDVLETLLANCGVTNPSWSEIRNFACFLSAQLSDCEMSYFTKKEAIQIDRRFTGFKKFVVKFMMVMSRDFSTPSLNVTDVSSVTTGTIRSPSVDRSLIMSPGTPSVELGNYFIEQRHRGTPIAGSSPSSMKVQRKLHQRPVEEQAIQPLRGGSPTGNTQGVQREPGSLDSSQSGSPLSLQGGDTQYDDDSGSHRETELLPFTLKRRWEESLHPYIFFNDDRQTFTFIGFVFDDDGRLLDRKTHRYHAKPLIEWTLKECLEDQGVECSQDFEVTYNTRDQQLEALGRVLGVPIRKEQPTKDPKNPIVTYEDPDVTYKLTADNIMKILAINMRFRCRIPVVIIGETGCGKTRLIRFMCKLMAVKKPKDVKVKNMILMKVHGGTTAKDIADRVRDAERIALDNKERYDIDTVLFFDEANTTEAIGLIKEIMCDGRILGRPMNTVAGGALKLIAACNPYRQHSPEMIKLMQSTGLGYHVKANKVKEKLGSIPFRELVYRVHPLPPSMRPLVWDFGRLSTSVEKKYIEQIVLEYVESEKMRASSNERRVIVSVLACAQEFMRSQKNECSFVSLRDVKRCMDVMVWFLQYPSLLGNCLNQNEEDDSLDSQAEQEVNTDPGEIGSSVTSATSASEMRRNVNQSEDDFFVALLSSIRVATEALATPALQTRGRVSGVPALPSSKEEKRSEENIPVDEEEIRSVENIDVTLTEKNTKQTQITALTKAIVLSLGVCYHARLREARRRFRESVAEKFTPPCALPGGAERMLEEIVRCQDIFLDGLDLGPNIARNAALKENVFMMVVCIELRIPLFLVGKPGTSKSLAKSIVSKSMQGGYAKSEFYRKLKQVHMLSCQCSPLSTSSDIKALFDRCIEFQKGKDVKHFVSVAVLDEVGLAEDSPKMPLKTLHPLLETSSLEDDEDKSKRIAFIGLSNWALDPAKMNRGIMVSREDLTEDDLIETARGICDSDQEVLRRIEKLIPCLAKAYQTICRNQEKEFFGLRDYYSLIKMVYTYSKISKKRPSAKELEHCVRRNFEGLVTAEDPMHTFNVCLGPACLEQIDDNPPECTIAGLLKASMKGEPTLAGANRDKCSDNRYLLILTENYSALPILQQELLIEDCVKDKKAVIIFGSSFPNDQEYTQVCRDINRIKICMETGQTVVLLNLENLYESLYDALNQYYAYFKDKRYVSLGLGTHKVKCKVDHSFRLIVIADKNVVYKRFPTPLVNRLEKHFLATSTMLSAEERELVHDLQENFVRKFAKITHPVDQEGYDFEVQDAFVGYHGDMVATLVFHARRELNSLQGDENWRQEVKRYVKYHILQCVTPEAVLRLPHSELGSEYDLLHDTYFKKQKHESLQQYLQTQLQNSQRDGNELYLQVTTHSTLLVTEDQARLAQTLQFHAGCLQSMFLKSFQTQQQCRDEVRRFYTENRDKERLLLVQCEDGNRNSQLIACASYCILDEKAQVDEITSDRSKPAHVVFVINLARMSSGFTSFPGRPWECVHIDDVRLATANRPEICSLMGLDMPELFDRPNEDIDISTSHLLIDSLHTAAARIEDSDHVSNRTTERISILQSVMNNDVTDLHRDSQEHNRSEEFSSADIVSRGDREVDRSFTSNTPTFRVVGNNNIVINQGAGSAVNLNLSPKFDLPVVVDIIDQTTKTLVPEVTSLVLTRLTRLTASAVEDVYVAQDEINVRLQEQNRRLLQQNQALLAQNQMLWRACRICANHCGHLHKVEEGSIVFTVGFGTAADLERFFEANQSGQLARDLQKCFITNNLELRAGLKLAVQLNIREYDYWNGLATLETFISVAKRRIGVLLQERRQFKPQEAQHYQWLSRKALALTSIQESGTFRRSLWQQLVATISPILAEIFAFFDYNNNLNILHENESHTWKYKLWLALANPAVSPLHYSTFTPPVEGNGQRKSLLTKEMSSKNQSRVREKAPVKSFGSGGIHFDAVIPFSWFIKENLDRWYTVAFEQTAKKKKPLLEIFKHLVINSALGKLLQHHIPVQSCAEFMEGYIHDFTRMTYKTTTHPDAINFELKCVEKSLKVCVDALSRRLKLFTIDDPVQELVCLHATYRQHVAKRLQQFSELVQACPELLKSEYHDKLLTQGNEMMLDVKAVEVLVVTHLVPSDDEKTQPEAQQAWLCKVKNVKVLIENVIMSVTKNQDDVYGEESQAIVKEIRLGWQRIRVLELFYEHVCVVPSTADERLAPQGRMVWNSFHGGADLKRIDKIKRLKTVLKMTTDKAGKLDFKFGIHESCGICSPNVCKDIENPVVLPCDHIWCEKCIRQWLGEGNRPCPKCNQLVSPDFQLICIPKNRDFQKNFQIFKQNRNNFFLEIVSQLCFADNTPPDEAVVDGLLNFVIGQMAASPASSQEVVFDIDSIDPDFTVRSVILQLLLQSCADKVVKFLEEYFSKCRQTSSAYSGEDVIVVCLMYLYCKENFLLSEESQFRSSYDNLLHGAIVKLRHATTFLTSQSGSVPSPSIPLLEAIAEARYGLILTSQFLHSMTIEGLKKQTDKADELFNEAQKFCIESICQQEAHLFLLKHICHSYGTKPIERLSWHPNLCWVLTSELQGRIQRIQDGFVVSGATYTNIRDAMYQSVSLQTMQPFLDAVQELQCSDNKKEAAVLLSIFREVTLSNAAMDPEKRATEEIKQALIQIIRSGSYKNKDIALRLIQNRLCGQESTHLVVASKQSYDHQMIIAIVVHSLVVILCSSQDYLRRPLRKLLLLPRLSELASTIAEMVKQHREEEQSTSQQDPIGDTILRIIVYSVMLGSAVDHPRAIAYIVSPVFSENKDVGEYLWKALSSDLTHLQTITRMTLERCVLLIHIVLDRILTTAHQEEAEDSKSPDALEASASSRSWQQMFLSTFISHVSKRFLGECTSAERKLCADKKDVVLQVLHKPEAESIEAATFGDVRKLATLPIAWQYQPRIDVETVQRHLESEAKKTGKQHELLRAFLQQEPVLRAMTHLPDIIRLQRLLIERFHRCIDAIEASKLSPADIDDTEIQQLMRSFIAAWNQVIDIEDNQLATNVGDANQYPIDIGNCNLALFLPTLTGDGICSTELVKFLIERHNAFIELYHGITGLQDKRTILPASVTHSHLIAYDLNKDLLPLIHAHCCHKLQGSTLTFNLDNLERAIEDHYIRGRPLIEKKVEEVVFLEGALSKRVFQAIRDKIPQESLSVAIKQDILSELKSITELCDCLAVTEIGIGFLASTGGDPDMYIIDYLEKDLNLPAEQRQQLSTKAHHCRLRHTLSLWQLLAVERAKRRLASKKQDPFEGLGKHLKEKIPTNDRDRLRRALRHVDVDDFVAELYEFIELQLRTMVAIGKGSKEKPQLMKELQEHLRQKKQVMIGIGKLMGCVHLPIENAVDVWSCAVQSKRHKETKV